MENLSDAATPTDEIRRGAADLFLLAYLLTGHTEESIDIAADAAVSEDGAHPFFSEWMRRWRRRLVIAKALASVRDELADSARRTKRVRLTRATRSPVQVPPGRAMNGADLERMLLAIDLFPRVVLLLLVYEGMRIADAAALLDADPALLKKAQIVALQALAASQTPAAQPHLRHSARSERCRWLRRDPAQAIP
jgi:hypothetical protein